MSNVIIPAEHQSSPKDTEISKAVREAARDIHSGRFTPELKENVFGKKEDEFWNAGITTALAQHPRVKDAMEKLETQVQDKTSVEYLEKAQQLHEMNEAMAAGERWEGQERWQGKTNREMRLVNLMQPKDFILKLQRAGVLAEMEPVVETDYRGDPATGEIRLCEVERSDARVWLGRRVVRGCVGVFANVQREARYINKLQVPLGPEWSVIRFDEYNVPINEEYHGWRTAVLALVRQQVITEAEAELAFGKPIENPASEFYRQQMAAFRSGR